MGGLFWSGCLHSIDTMRLRDSKSVETIQSMVAIFVMPKLLQHGAIAEQILCGWSLGSLLAMTTAFQLCAFSYGVRAIIQFDPREFFQPKTFEPRRAKAQRTGTAIGLKNL